MAGLTVCGSARYNYLMGRRFSKKGIERRKKPRSTGSRRKTVSNVPKQEKDTSSCYNCGTNLKNSERALFVEEEVGRIFCSEVCITSYFSDDVKQLEKEYFRRLSPDDFSDEKREQLGYLRWITLEEPDEAWRQKTAAGDFRYTLISEFKPSNKSVWCICICLLLRGEPSFLFLAFPTMNSEMVEHYRRGEKVKWIKPAAAVAEAEADVSEQPQSEKLIDGLADEWTPDETVRAQISQKRKSNDIPVEEFELYHACFEQTLEEPDEVWSIRTSNENEDGQKVYHFIRHYPEEKPGVWFVIVARETDKEEQIEVVDAFPTRDSELVERYRVGEQEAGFKTMESPSRLIH